MGKTNDKARELLNRTNALLDSAEDGSRDIHTTAWSAMAAAVVVLEDVLGEDDTSLPYSEILTAWENQPKVQEVNGL